MADNAPVMVLPARRPPRCAGLPASTNDTYSPAGCSSGKEAPASAASTALPAGDRWTVRAPKCGCEGRCLAPRSYAPPSPLNQSQLPLDKRQLRYVGQAIWLRGAAHSLSPQYQPLLPHDNQDSFHTLFGSKELRTILTTVLISTATRLQKTATIRRSSYLASSCAASVQTHHTHKLSIYCHSASQDSFDT